MDTVKRNISLRTILIIFFVILFFMAESTNLTHGAGADFVMIPVLMVIFGLIGTVPGAVIGGVIGLIGKLFKKDIFLTSLKYGAALGFMGMLSVWYLGCLMNGSAVCIAQ